MVLAAVVAGTVVGCSGDSGAAQETATLNPYDQLTESAPPPSPTVTTAPPATDTTNLPHGDDVASWLTPPGATVSGTSSNEVVLMSSDPLDTLVTFYDGVLAQMGAQGTSGREGTAWGYVGTYDGKPIQVQVAVVDSSGRCSIIITY